MKSACARFLIVFFALTSIGCTPGFVMESGRQREFAGKLILTGSSTVAPLAAEIAKRFEARHPGVRIDVQTGGSGKGIADARVGIADIGMASRALKSDEDDLTAHKIAADGVGLIVHDANEIPELSRDQIVAIYTGQVTNWRDVGGKDLPITVVHKADGRATLDVFLSHFDIENPAVKADVIVGDNQHAVKTVAGIEGAIAYLSIGTAEAEIRTGVPIRLLSLEGVKANTVNVARGNFPMSRPLNLVTVDTPTPLAANFIRFCQSADVRDLVESQCFVPIEHEEYLAK